MIKNARTAVKFFVYGLVLGLLFAPRSGAETRKELMGWVTGSVKEAISSATGSSGGSGSSGESGTSQSSRLSGR